MVSRQDRRAFIELPYRLHSNAQEVGAPAPHRAAPVPRSALQRLLHARRGRALPGPARRAGRGSRSARRSTSPSTSSTTTPGACSGSSSWRRTPRCSRPCSTPPRAGCASAAATAWSGPMDFTMNDESGVLIEGYERPPMIRQPWHPPYYRELCEGAGLEKAMDLFMWELHISDREKVMPIIWELADAARAQARHHDPQDEPAPPAPRARCVRRDLQRGLVAQLGLRPLLEGGSRRLRARSSSSCTTATGSWSPRTPGRRPWGSRSACPTSTRCCAR